MELFLKIEISKRQISSKTSQMNRSDLETQICQRNYEKQQEFYFQAHTVEDFKKKELIIILSLFFDLSGMFLSLQNERLQSEKIQFKLLL